MQAPRGARAEPLRLDVRSRAGRRLVAAAVLLVCALALHVTGFFDAQRFMEGAPAIRQLASEMVPPNFARWEHWVIPLRDTLAMSIAGTALTIVQDRQNFTQSFIGMLSQGSDMLTVADTNEEGANLLALQTRQQLSITALSLATQADQGVLRLFG